MTYKHNVIIEYPIPAFAVTVLKNIQRAVPRAFVAGGCLRDTIMGRPINDIDVFVPEGQDYMASEVLRNNGAVVTKSIPEPYFTMNNDVRSVRYFEGHHMPLPVNIIGVYNCTPEAQLERFDFGICRVAYDGIRLWKDLAFDRDQADETFSLLVDQTEDQRNYSLGRYERLSGKYPGWKFVDKLKHDNWWKD